MDLSFVFVFSRGETGKFLCEIGKYGRSPRNEYQISLIAYDYKIFSYLFIRVGANNVMVFWLDGKYLRTFQTPPSNKRNGRPPQSDLWVFTAVCQNSIYIVGYY